LNQNIKGFLIGCIGTAAVVFILLPFRPQLNSTPVALALILVVLFTSARFGQVSGVATSIVAMFSLNFFFLPPVGTLTISDPQNWIALAAFLGTSLIAGGLSAREKRRIEEAEEKKKEIEHLYFELQKAFKKANEAEALEQSEKLKTALLDAVTHELRTPLTSIKAAVTTLLSGSAAKSSGFELDDEGRREMLEVVRDEVDRLNHIVEGLIDVAQVEAGAMYPRRGWTQLDEVIANALRRAAALTKNHPVKLELEKNLPLLRIDEKAIAEVLYVLVQNAAKYSPAGGEIHISANRSNDNSLLIRIEDQGPGIPLEFREKVFEKFFRLSPSEGGRSGVPGGLGMGLAIARGIVESHGGKIWIEDNRAGRGAGLVLTLPIAANEERQLSGTA
jgi:K+-sensing histidine kinase KdpD